MKSLVKNIVRQIGKWIEKVPVLCNIVLAFGMAFLLEVLGRQTFDQGVFGFVNDRTKMFLYSAFIIFVTYSVGIDREAKAVYLHYSDIGLVSHRDRQFSDAQCQKYSIHVCGRHTDEICTSGHDQLLFAVSHRLYGCTYFNRTGAARCRISVSAQKTESAV